MTHHSLRPDVRLTVPPDAAPGPSGAPEAAPEGGVGLLERPAAQRPWRVLVWNDPVNLMSYVIWVFRAHFGHSRAEAHRLMLQVHEEGRAVVFTGSREEAERHTGALHGYGLWATFEQEDA